MAADTRKRTILLDTEAWDWVIDSHGNIAVADPPYSTAQDVASAIRLFLGEGWYDTTQGIPYFEKILGQLPTQSAVQAYFEKAALSVPGVVKAKCVITAFEDRKVTGNLTFIDWEGKQNGVQF